MPCIGEGLSYPHDIYFKIHIYWVIEHFLFNLLVRLSWQIPMGREALIYPFAPLFVDFLHVPVLQLLFPYLSMGVGRENSLLLKATVQLFPSIDMHTLWKQCR